MITLVTRQNLLADKTRFAISVGGVALSVFLIAFLLSLFQGWNLNIGRFVENVEADVWVAREGTTDFLNATSILDEEAGLALAGVPGVSGVDALVVRPMAVEIDGEQRSMHLVGYTGAGGPPRIIEGSEEPGPNELIIDEAFGRQAGVDVGERFVVGGREMEVVGRSSGGNLVFSQTVFAPLETVREVLGMEGLSTFFLLHLEDGVEADEVIPLAAGIEGADAFSSEEFTNATRERIMENFIPILIIILGLAFAVGVAITGLTIYTATVEKSREFGILKALGFTNGYLMRVVVEQSLITGAVGFAVGAGLTALASQFVSDVVPQFVTLLRWQDILMVLVVTLLMGLAASLLPVRRVASVDPVTVFSA